MHLVNVAAHCLRQHIDPAQEGVGSILHDTGTGPDVQQQRVQQGKAFGVAVQYRRLRKIHKGPGHGERRGRIDLR